MDARRTWRFWVTALLCFLGSMVFGERRTFGVSTWMWLTPLGLSVGIMAGAVWHNARTERRKDLSLYVVFVTLAIGLCASTIGYLDYRANKLARRAMAADLLVHPWGTTKEAVFHECVGSRLTGRKLIIDSNNGLRRLLTALQRAMPHEVGHDVAIREFRLELVSSDNKLLILDGWVGTDYPTDIVVRKMTQWGATYLRVPNCAFLVRYGDSAASMDESCEEGNF